MAVTTQKSAQETNRTANPPVKNSPHDTHGRLRVSYFSFQQDGAGDANSLVDMVTLPPGKVRLIKSLSHIHCSALGASRLLDVGFLGYTEADGDVISASADTILDGADVSGAAVIQCGAGTNALADGATHLFDSRLGVTIQGKVLADTIPDDATFEGYFVYVID